VLLLSKVRNIILAVSIAIDAIINLALNTYYICSTMLKYIAALYLKEGKKELIPDYVYTDVNTLK
jgi:hypothetical protein